MNSAPARPRLTENPWFWVHLFSAAALIGLLLIGPKADQVQAQRDGNFTRRQASLERQAEQARVADEAAFAPESIASEASIPESERHVDFKPFYLALGAVMAGSWIMLWRQHFRRGKNPPTLRQGPA